MPKSVIFLFAAVCIALAIPACNNNNSSVVTTPSASLTPNPSLTAATISVTRLSTPAAFVPVQISTPANTASPRPGTPFATHQTGKKGMAKFTHLNPVKNGGWYCWVATLGPNETSSTCANWEIWQYQPVPLGT